MKMLHQTTRAATIIVFSLTGNSTILLLKLQEKPGFAGPRVVKFQSLVCPKKYSSLTSFAFWCLKYLCKYSHIKTTRINSLSDVFFMSKKIRWRFETRKASGCDRLEWDFSEFQTTSDHGSVIDRICSSQLKQTEHPTSNTHTLKES